MTYHIKLDKYNCPQCQMAYIPFKARITCPKCGFCDPDTGKYYGFINEIIRSMTINKRKDGRYRPSAWYIGSMSDNIQSTCFHFFDYLEQEKPSDPVTFLNNYTGSMEVDNEFDRKYIKAVLTEIYSHYGELEKIKKGSFAGNLIIFLRQFWPW